jgi:hypothetical protein
MCPAKGTKSAKAQGAQGFAARPLRETRRRDTPDKAMNCDPAKPERAHFDTRTMTAQPQRGAT